VSINEELLERKSSGCGGAMSHMLWLHSVPQKHFLVLIYVKD
jgi:hypothetical protein